MSSRAMPSYLAAARHASARKRASELSGARGDRRPGGDVRFGYYPLHGAPRMYYSAYDCAFVAELAVGIRGAAAKEAWCIFDNTASGAATADALAMQTQVTNAVRKASP